MAASGSKLDRQRDSTLVTGVEQFELRIARRATPMVVDIDAVRRQRTLTAAILLCVTSSGLTDGDIATHLAIDSATWSRIKSGGAHFPQDKLDRLMEICGNDAPLQWLAMQRGFELRPLRSELEQQIEDLKAQLAERERDFEVAKRLFHEMRR